MKRSWHLANTRAAPSLALTRKRVTWIGCCVAKMKMTRKGDRVRSACASFLSTVGQRGWRQYSNGPLIVTLHQDSASAKGARPVKLADQADHMLKDKASFPHNRNWTRPVGSVGWMPRDVLGLEKIHLIPN